MVVVAVLIDDLVATNAIVTALATHHSNAYQFIENAVDRRQRPGTTMATGQVGDPLGVDEAGSVASHHLEHPCAGRARAELGLGQAPMGLGEPGGVDVVGHGVPVGVLAPLIIMRIVFSMAKTGARVAIRMVSTAGTGHSYMTNKNRRTTPERLELRKYDPVVRRHVTYRESR